MTDIPTNADLDELDLWLLLAVDAGYSLATGQAPLPTADPGVETRIAGAVALWKARMGYADDEERERPAWLEDLIAEGGG